MSHPFRFRLPIVFWLLTLVAASLATFGVGGFLYAFVVGLFWRFVFAADDPRNQFVVQIAALLLVLVSFTCLLPLNRHARGPARRTQCINNVKQISLALLNYESAHGRLPPPFIADENGKPMHSWRVLILPFAEHDELFKTYRFDEPWDGPNNSKLIPLMPSFYCCPSHDAPAKGLCHYAAIVGPDTAWQQEPLSFDSMAAGTSNTLIVCETLQGIPWTKPSDLTPEEYLQQAKVFAENKSEHGHASTETAHYKSQLINVGFVDGHVATIYVPSKANALKKLASRHEKFDSTNNDPLLIELRAQTSRAIAGLLMVSISLLPGWRLLTNRPASSNGLSSQ